MTPVRQLLSFMSTLKGITMTRSIQFAGLANPTSGAAAPRTAPAASWVQQALSGLRALIAAPAASRAEAYPWLTPAIRSSMGVRAQRLLRADY